MKGQQRFRPPPPPEKFVTVNAKNVGRNRYELEIDIGEPKTITRYVRVMPQKQLEALQRAAS